MGRDKGEGGGFNFFASRLTSSGLFLSGGVGHACSEGVEEEEGGRGRAVRKSLEENGVDKPRVCCV